MEAFEPPSGESGVLMRPAWCDGRQCKDDDPRDRQHQAERWVPAIWSGDGSAGAVAMDIYMTVYKGIESNSDTWIHFGSAENGQGITITLESAQRLHRELEILLRDIQQSP